jgi:hypothetical protein
MIPGGYKMGHTANTTKENYKGGKGGRERGDQDPFRCVRARDISLTAGRWNSLTAHLSGVVCIVTFFMLQHRYPKSVWTSWRFFVLFRFNVGKIVEEHLVCIVEELQSNCLRLPSHLFLCS